MPITNLSNKRPPYVIFIKGTPAAFKKLEKKDPNTLYYISEKESHRGSLYLGDKLITSGKDSITSLNCLDDVLIDEGLEEKSFLFYDGTYWVNKTIQEIVAELPYFSGSTETESGSAGLVPPPEAGKEDYFLKADGTWEYVRTDIDTITDEQIEKLFEEVE